MTAKDTLWQYLREGLEMTPPFKGYGMQFIKFTCEKPELFRELFIDGKEPWEGYRWFLSDIVLADEVIPSIMQTFGLNTGEARTLFEKVCVNCFGISLLLLNNPTAFSETEIADMLGFACRAYLLAIKTGGDGRTNYMPRIGGKMTGKINEYIKSPFQGRFSIAGVDSNKSTARIFLDDILYFEAVGELVFAYTKDEVYEIKKRLYQIEADVNDKGFIRVSKSVIINLNEVRALHPGINRCIYAYLSNEEQILVSRNYAKEVVAAVKHLWGE